MKLGELLHCSDSQIASAALRCSRCGAIRAAKVCAGVKAKERALLQSASSSINIVYMNSVLRAAAVCAFFAVCFVAVAVAGTTPEGKAWLAKKAQDEGVIATGSGLLYKVLKSGPDGAKKPRIDTPCECHYKGTLIDGREFDSSYSRGMPATFAPNQVLTHSI